MTSLMNSTKVWQSSPHFSHPTEYQSILNHEEIEILNKLVSSKKIRLVNKNLPVNNIPGQDGLTCEFKQTFKEELIPILLILF